MIYPEINEPKDQIWVIHCTHQDCNDTPIYFNDISGVDKFLYKHGDWYNGREGKNKHGDPRIWTYKRVKEYSEQEIFNLKLENEYQNVK